MEATVVGGRDAEVALEPLLAGLRAAEDAGITLGVAPGLVVGRQDGWHSIDGMPLEEMVAQAAERWSAPPHVAAALWWKGFSYWTTLPVVLGWALTRRVPVMTAATVVVRPLEAQPHMLVGISEAGVVAGDGRTIRETLIEGLHAPVIERLNGLTRTGRRGLWGSVAEALVEPFALLAANGAGDVDGVDGVAGAEELIGAIGGPVAGLFDVRSGLRRTCCLWVALPGRGACSTCCVREAPC